MKRREAAEAASLYSGCYPVTSMAREYEIIPQPQTGRFWRYGPLLFWMALIFFASTSDFSAANTSKIIRPLLLWLFPRINDQQIAFVHFLVRKAAHFTEYAIFALLAARAFFCSSHFALRRTWFLAALLLIAVYALGDEYHQSFEPSRTASIYDSLIDIAGGLTALLPAYWRWRRSGTLKVEGSIG